MRCWLADKCEQKSPEVQFAAVSVSHSFSRYDKSSPFVSLNPKPNDTLHGHFDIGGPSRDPSRPNFSSLHPAPPGRSPGPIPSYMEAQDSPTVSNPMLLNFLVSPKTRLQP